MTLSFLQSLDINFDPLSSSQKRCLDEDGFLILKDMISPEWREELVQRFEQLIEQERGRKREDFEAEDGARRLSNLVNKGQIFDAIYTNPLVLSAVHYVLQRPFKLSSLNGRDAIPGEGQQPLHVDWGDAPPPEGPYHVVNSVWLLDDFELDNGATRVVPGSHRWGKGPHQCDLDPMEAHPDEVIVQAKAGSVIIFNSHLWHGGTLNTSGNKRRALHCYFCAEEHDQQTNQAEALTGETRRRLAPHALKVLDAL